MKYDGVEGEERGFMWRRYTGENGKKFLIVHGQGQSFPTEEEISKNLGYAYSDKHVYPLTDGVAEGIDIVSYHNNSMASGDLIKHWARSIPTPPSCRIEVDYSPYGSDPVLTLAALTIRHGRLERVERRIRRNHKHIEDCLPAILDIYAYFERNCPAPSEGEADRITISTVGHALVALVDTDSADRIARWHAKCEDKNNPYIGSVAIDGIGISAKGIEKLTLKRSPKQRQVLVDINLEGGHIYREDGRGATVEIMTTPADAIVAAARGKALSDMVGIPGAGQSTIRTSSKGEHVYGPNNVRPYIRLRATHEAVDFELPTGSPEGPEETMKQLEALMGPDGHFKHCEAGLAAIFEDLDAILLKRILATLKASEQVWLKDYGLPDICIAVSGERIYQSYSNSVSLPSPRKFLRDAA